MATTSIAPPTLESDRAPSNLGRTVGRYGLLYSLSAFFVLFAGIPFAWMISDPPPDAACASSSWTAACTRATRTWVV